MFKKTICPLQNTMLRCDTDCEWYITANEPHLTEGCAMKLGVLALFSIRAKLGYIAQSDPQSSAKSKKAACDPSLPRRL